MVNGGRSRTDKKCPVHNVNELDLELVSVMNGPKQSPPVDRRKRKPIILRIGMRDGICKCTMDGKGCVTNLSFNCSVHAKLPETNSIPRNF
jgi:hypothetical protein